MRPRRTNCTLTKAASIPARRQRAQGFLDLFFDAAPHLEYFFQFLQLSTKAAFVRKIRAPIKIKSALPPPPPPKKKTQKGEFYGHGFSYRKNAFFPGVHKIGAPISGPRIADTNFTDTRIFLNLLKRHLTLSEKGARECLQGEHL